jgi:acyl-CoA thioester hydrolase
MISATLTLKAQFYDLDPMQVVWHGHYARFLEQARCALLDKIEFNYLQMSQTRYIWPIVDLRIKYIRPIRFAQEIDVTATLSEHENRLKIDYAITDVCTGEILTKAHTIQVAVDSENNEVCFESPPELLEKVRCLL